MKSEEKDSSLWLMNAAVGLVILIPLLLLIWQDQQQENPIPPKPLDQPPIITLPEADGYSFPTGKAVLSIEFERLLGKIIIPKLQEFAQKYECDIIEVIGHTDEQPVNSISRSSLDANLLSALNGETRSLTAGSNLDLGLMRAWSVIHFLKSDHKLYGIKFYGYSAGQTILPDGNIAKPHQKPGDEPARRRIEIRLRRSPGKAISPKEGSV